MPTNMTALRLIGIGLAPWSANGISETLKPEDSGEIRRTVSGKAVCTAIAETEKYGVSISCEDLSPPSFDGIFRGSPVTVECVSRHSANVATGDTSVTLGRTPVAGSITVIDEDGGDVAFTVVGNVVSFSAQPKEITVEYSPVLNCLVDTWSVDRDDFGASTSWSLDLVEV